MSIVSTRFSLLAELKRDSASQNAWAEFVDRYHGAIYGWSLRHGLDHHSAEDLTQDILVKLMYSLPRYNYDPSKGRFRGWLKTVVANALADAWRQRERRPEPRGVGGDAGLLDGLCDVERAVDELTGLIQDRSESPESAALERVRQRVKESSWQAFYQTWCAHRPAKDVARELGLSVASVYKHKLRLRQMVLQEYAGLRKTAAPRH